MLTKQGSIKCFSHKQVYSEKISTRKTDTCIHVHVSLFESQFPVSIFNYFYPFINSMYITRTLSTWQGKLVLSLPVCILWCLLSNVTIADFKFEDFPHMYSYVEFCIPPRHPFLLVEESQFQRMILHYESMTVCLQSDIINSLKEKDFF